jgi:hypothetical protein
LHFEEPRSTLSALINCLKKQEKFAGKYGNEEMGRNCLVFVTEKTLGASEALRGGFEVIGPGLGGKMITQ